MVQCSDRIGRFQSDLCARGQARGVNGLRMAIGFLMSSVDGGSSVQAKANSKQLGLIAHLLSESLNML